MAKHKTASPKEERVLKKVITEGGIVRMEAAFSSRTCSACEHVNAGTTDLFFTCQSCGTLHDQDDNAVRNFLAAA